MRIVHVYMMEGIQTDIRNAVRTAQRLFRVASPPLDSCALFG
jgi:hypothetical protein